MKINRYFVLQFAIYFLLSLASKAQHNYLSPTVRIPSHPRLLLLKGEESELLENMKRNSALITINNQIISQCDKLISSPPLERIKIGKRILNTSREALKRIFYLAYAWRITNNNKYLRRGEKELLSVSNFSDWNPDHFLDVAEMTMGVSLGYDWLYDGLSQSAKNIIKNAIIEKGLRPSLNNRYNGWLENTNNWNQVCNAGITYGALAVYEDQPGLARVIINRAINSIKLPMTGYSPNGAYPEGYSYWCYGTDFNVIFLDAIEKLFHQDFGLSKAPGFLQTPRFMENMTGPSGKGFNFSDSGLKSEQPEPAMFWFAEKLHDPSLLWTEKNHFSDAASGDNLRNRLLPAVMVFSDHLNLTSITPPTDLMWVGAGKTPVALMRSSWIDSNAIYIAAKGGSPSNSHGHMDIGSFIMEASGVRWAMDFGMEDYNNIESQGIDLFNNKQNSARWQIFRYNNLAHNTITIEKQLQNVDGYAPITKISKNPLSMFAIIDLTSIYKSHVKTATRGIALIDKKYVVVKDEIQAISDTSTVQWNMLTPAKVKILSNTRAELTNKGKKMILQVIQPENIVLQTRNTIAPHEYESSNEGTLFVGFTTKATANRTCNLTVLLIPAENESPGSYTVKPLNQWSTENLIKH